MQKGKKKFHDYSILRKYEVLEGAIKEFGCFEHCHLQVQANPKKIAQKKGCYF